MFVILVRVGSSEIYKVRDFSTVVTTLLNLSVMDWSQVKPTYVNGAIFLYDEIIGS